MLSKRKIDRLLGSPGRYLDGDCLYLQVPPAGEKQPRQTRASWLLRYRLDGRERWMGLGSLSTFTLEQARARAKTARELLADGIDPLDQKRQQAAAQLVEKAKDKTFADVTQEYFAAHRARWAEQQAVQFTSSLRDHAMHHLGSVPVKDIDTPLVIKVLKPIWGEKTTTAKRVRQRIASVLDYAKVAGYRTGDNAARWEGHLEHLLAAPDKIAKVEHMAALPYSEAPAFMAELRAAQGVPACALEFAVLTATRTKELRFARWDEIEGSTWTIPAERMKARKEHRVPLSKRALDILSELPREQGNPFVFIGARAREPIGHDAMIRLLKSMRPGLTVHGFRSSFRDWAGETTAFPPDVCEAALAHQIGDSVQLAYQRGDLFKKREKLMEAWATYCSLKASDVVVQIKARKS